MQIWASSHTGAVVIVAGALAAGAACGAGSSGATACGPPVREHLDPAYLVHVLGDGADVHYRSDPPTSGPHKAGPPVSGVVDAPIARPVQVGILERGDILLQHDPGLAAAPLADLERLAGAGIVVAPNPELPDLIVATAWTYKQRCTSVDLEALRAFIRAHAGKGPDS
ncbi:MAG: DUF3105 domain-containing protein [Acidimicrobiales bacterium]